MSSPERVWTDERVAAIKQHHRDGLSSPASAAKLGAGFTPRMVTSKLHREGVKPHDKAATNLQSKLTREAGTVPHAPLVRPPRADAFQPIRGTEPVPFASPGCKWPIDLGAEPMACGQPQDGEHSYCGFHRLLGHQSPPNSAKELARKLRWAMST